MSTISLYRSGRFWGGMTAAFALGVVVGFVLCYVVLVALTVMTSYAGHSP
ncbi:MAG TPA: hypothetical protein VGN12_27470 [Pirellulales bacterium]